MKKKLEPTKAPVVKETFAGRIDVNEYFKVLILEAINRENRQDTKKTTRSD